MRHGAWSGCFSKAENAPATETGVGTVLWKTSVSWSWLVANRTQEAPHPQYFSLGAVPSSTHKVGCPLGSTREVPNRGGRATGESWPLCHLQKREARSFA